MSGGESKGESPDPEEIGYAKFKKFSDRYNREKDQEEREMRMKDEKLRKEKEEADRKAQEEESSLGFLGIGR